MGVARGGEEWGGERVGTRELWCPRFNHRLQLSRNGERFRPVGLLCLFSCEDDNIVT